MESKTHWENIYKTKDATQVSWFQLHPEISFHFIERTGVDPQGQIIDVGGGASTLVDDLLANNYQNITVLDLSSSALQVAQRRLGLRASGVTWLEGDITRIRLPYRFYDVWHDRAVFHFLTNHEDRVRYVEAVQQSVKVGGHVIVATFGPDGPLRCSGLEVVRYSADELHNEFGDDFKLIDTSEEFHHTPFETEQKFIYCYCRKV
ncbi:MAG TPA: class I SAM-dependent methyltransferase [Blastocatellia bacterium]|nr:class I SAM-dependent methyltransferase [Blastocatellia bacterium]